MNVPSEQTEGDAAPGVLDAFLNFVACCIETPAEAARLTAIAVTLAACAIVASASLMGTGAGAGLGVFYAGSCWALLLILRAGQRKV